MFEFKCATTCPDEFSANNRICEYTGFACPFGWTANAAGDACDQYEGDKLCDGSSVLNYD